MKSQLIVLLALIVLSFSAQAEYSRNPTHVIFVTGINTAQNLRININPTDKITYYPYLAKKFESEFPNLKMEEIWHPLSWDITVSAQYLSSHINRALLSEPGTDFILVGQSKGAVELLLTLLKNPDWIKNDKIKKVIMLQGAFGGSYLPNIVRRLMGNRDNLGYLAGLWSLEHGRPLPVIDEQFALYPQELVDKLSDKIYFLRSFRLLADTPMLTHLFFRLLEGYGPNDGALLLDDQMVPKKLGHDLGILKAAHMDLVTDAYYSLSNHSYKLNFTNELFDKVFKEGMNNPFSADRERP